MPACNWRFGASGGVARPKVCADFQVSALVRAAVKPPPAPSRSHVVCNACGAVFKRIIAKDLGQRVKKSKLANLGQQALKFF